MDDRGDLGAGGDGGGGAVSDGPALLVVATVRSTIRGFLLPYAAHFRARGWRVDAAAAGAASDEVLASAFDRVHDLSITRSVRDIGAIARGIREMAALLGTGYDIVHVHTPIASFVVRAASRLVPARRRPSVVYTAHGFHFHSRGNPFANAVFVTAEKAAGRWTDHLIVINAEDRASALRHRLVPGRRLSYMPGIGVDTDAFSPSAVSDDEIDRFRSRIGVPPGAPLFVVMGELNRGKRPLDVLRALSSLAHADAHLAFLGDGAERPTLEAESEPLGLRSRVHLPGLLPEVRPALAASVALISASSREGLSRSIMEALSMGVPVIASDARGNAELVMPDAGHIFPVGDVPELARAMDQVLDDPQRSRTMGEAGRARMIERFDIRSLLTMHERLYSDVLKRAGSV